MADTVAPPPVDEPDVVVPDAAPLIQPASAGLLRLPHEIGAAVVEVDMVAHEITRDRTEPGAEALTACLEAGRTPGSNRPARVDETETGRLYAAVWKPNPTVIDVVTTRAFLDGVERRDRAARGDDPGVPGLRYRDRVVTTSSAADPGSQNFSRRRPPR